MSDKRLVIFIVGPTSSGKTRVAEQLAGRICGEVIACDSMQVYRDMDVLTHASPGRLSRMIAPEEEYDAARFISEAEKAIRDVIGSGKTPVFAGGTGFYMKVLIDGIFPSTPRDDEIRKDLEKEAKEKGKEHLHRRLGKVDPETAAKLHPNDLKRVIRALEVYELTGETIHRKKKEAEGIGNKYDIRIFGLELPRDILYDRINASVDDMLEKGMIKQVESLRKRNLSRTAAQALGIKEISAYLEGEITLDKAVDELKKNTRNYAKRQLTWFRGDARVVWINAVRDTGEIVEEILRYAG